MRDKNAHLFVLVPARSAQPCDVATLQPVVKRLGRTLHVDVADYTRDETVLGATGPDPPYPLVAVPMRLKGAAAEMARCGALVSRARGRQTMRQPAIAKRTRGW